MILYIMTLIYVFFCTDYVFNLNNYFRNGVFGLLLIALIIVFFKYFKDKIDFKDEKIKTLIKVNKNFILLYSIMMLYSIIIHLINGNFGLIVSTLVTCSLTIIAILIAFFSTLIFKKKNLKYVLIAVISTYSIIFLKFLIKNGISGLINFRYLNKTFIDNGLEAHELMFSIGALLLYFIMTCGIKLIDFKNYFKNFKFNIKIDNLKNLTLKKKYLLIIILLIIFSFLGLKRIIVLALGVCLILHFISLFIKNSKKYNKFLKIFSISIIMIYLLCFTALLEPMTNLLNAVGINTMGRLDLYTYIQNLIHLSPLSFGYGIRYTEFLLAKNTYMRFFGAIHNDILRLYIENGIYLFVFILYTYFIKTTKVIKNICNDIQVKEYLLIILFFFLGCFTDNLTTYYRFIFVIFCIINHIIYKTNIDKNYNERYLNLTEKTNGEDLISLVVPIYNVANYLPSCIDDLINQTYKNIEIILVNDGSKDNSKEICESYLLKDSRIKLLDKVNGGLSDARNYGLKQAKGKYVIFVDSDDLVSNQMVEILYSIIRKNNADVGIIDPTHFIDGEKPIYSLSDEIEVYNKEKAIKTMLYQKKFLVSAWGKIYKRSMLKNDLFPVGRIFEDTAVMYKIFDKCKKIVYNPSKLYGYRHRDDSITTKKFSKRDFDILIACDEMNEYFKNSNKDIKKSVDCYTLNANFRVYLNGYGFEEFKDRIDNCYEYINKNLFKNLINIHTRLKLKLAIILFKINKSLMFKMYSKIDRWK